MRMDEHNKKILKSLDNAINDGPWDKSLFLQAIGKKLKDLRSDFTTKLSQASNSHIKEDISRNLVTQGSEQADQHKIFISLYNADGNNVSKWKNLLVNLSKHIITRPLYREEEAVQALLRSKVNKSNEAYVIVNVNPTDILSVADDQILKDRLGQPLITIADQAVRAVQAVYFVHISGFYKFINNTLIRQGDMVTVTAD